MNIIIDGNEANVVERVGSNIYAYEILHALAKMLTEQSQHSVLILTSRPALNDLPPPTERWRYQTIGPAAFWTQWALPRFLRQTTANLLFTPGHYAPRWSPIPVVSTVLDLAFLRYPQQFTISDRLKLTLWTAQSVKLAEKIITISQYSKRQIIQEYQISADKVVVAPPALPTHQAPTLRQSARESQELLSRCGVYRPYFLMLGTLQPRKRIGQAIKALELLAARSAKWRPQLILAGKLGWMSEPILRQIAQSKQQAQIIQLGFVTAKLKQALLQNSTATLHLGDAEGFGIPVLESLAAGGLPIVDRSSSLTEAAGSAGWKTDASDAHHLAKMMLRALRLSNWERQQHRRQAGTQLRQFAWDRSAELIWRQISGVVHAHHRH